MICLLTLIWLLWEEDEFDRIIPGAWDEMNNVLDPLKKNLGKIAPALEGIIPSKDLAALLDYNKQLKQIKTDTKKVLGELFSHTDDVLAKLNERIQGALPRNEVEQITQRSQAISAKMQVYKQLTGSAQTVHESQEAEKSKDVANKVSRRK